MQHLPVPPNIPVPGFPVLQPQLPVGCVIAFAGPLTEQNSPPTFSPVESMGWLVCDGRTLKIAQYPDLYRVLGTQYGGNPNQDEFQIPDLRGQFLRGVAVNASQDPDFNSRTAANQNSPGSDPVGSTELDALQTHAHDYQGFEQTAPAQEGSIIAAPTSANTPTGGPVSIGNVQVRISTETRPKNVYVYYLIKAF